jgi:hypothetical protein
VQVKLINSRTEDIINEDLQLETPSKGEHEIQWEDGLPMARTPEFIWLGNDCSCVSDQNMIELMNWYSLPINGRATKPSLYLIIAKPIEYVIIIGVLVKKEYCSVCER